MIETELVEDRGMRIMHIMHMDGVFLRVHAKLVRSAAGELENRMRKSRQYGSRGSPTGKFQDGDRSRVWQPSRMKNDPADEWQEWFRMAPLERWSESMKLWAQYLAHA